MVVTRHHVTVVVCSHCVVVVKSSAKVGVVVVCSGCWQLRAGYWGIPFTDPKIEQLS